ncbi:hypothetical protein J3E68DRAFT_407815 [Trichoderma sp. SZMC 28012]
MYLDESSSPSLLYHFRHHLIMTFSILTSVSFIPSAPSCFKSAKQHPQVLWMFCGLSSIPWVCLLFQWMHYKRGLHYRRLFCQ